VIQVTMRFIFNLGESSWHYDELDKIYRIN